MNEIRKIEMLFVPWRGEQHPFAVGFMESTSKQVGKLPGRLSV